MAVDYAINYEDERFQKVENEKQEALNKNDSIYDGMTNQSDKFYQDQIDASKEWTDKQQQIQQENTDFAIEKVEQQKAEAEKAYQKEQQGAYIDWQKQSNQYGAEAEKRAAQGLSGTGYSESSQVSMYNTYQNRVSAARESYQKAVLNYDNAIKEAHLQNNAKLAEIAYQALQKELELSLSGFQYKNNLLIEQANKKLEIENMYHNRWQDVLNQINTENSLAESVRQYNESMEMQKKQLEEQIRQHNESIKLQQQQLDEERRQYNESLKLEREKLAKSRSSGSSGSGRSSGNSRINKTAQNDSKVADKASKTINTGVAMLDALVNSVVGGYKKR